METFWHALRALILLICVSSGATKATAGNEAANPPKVRLAAGEKSLMPIVIADTSSERVRRAAETLADYLNRMSGAKFVVETNDGQAGIAIGRVTDFPQLGLQSRWDSNDPTRREDYLLRTHSKGLQLIGATDLAVEYGVWDLLYRLGYRQFFPGPVWEVVPRVTELSIAVESREHPAFLSRDIGYGFGPWEVRGKQYEEWCVRNRVAAGRGDRPLLDSGHAYDHILAELKDEFAKHPEYLAEIAGKRQLVPGETKFCISNPDLRRLVARYAVEQFNRRPNATSISLEPSDGLSWCECSECRKLGSVSDQAITLTNEAAAAIREKHSSQKLISIYAYGAHSPPPSIRVDPQIVVSVATSMTFGGYTTDQLMEGWRKRGAQLGVREYYGVYPWDRDLPGNSRTTYPAYIQRSIPHLYEQGARFLTAESSDNWGVAGLSYYLMSRLLWNPREADRVSALSDDFLDKAFGSAREPMARFYQLIDRTNQPRLSSDLIGRMYRLLDGASTQTSDPAVAARIRELVLYTRYVELYRDMISVFGPDRQQAFENLLRFTYRIRTTGMVHSLAVWRGLAHYDGTVKMPRGSSYEVPEDKDPLKDKSPITAEEVQQILVAGISRHAVNHFTPISFSTELVPATPLNLPDVPQGHAGLYFRELATFYTWAATPPIPLTLTVKPGVIQTNVGNTRLRLREASNTEGGAQLVISPDQKQHSISLSPAKSGLHRLELTDGTAGTMLSWPSGTVCTIPSGPSESTDLYSRWTLYFYVPKGTKTVAGYADGPGDLFDSSGQKVLTFTDWPDYFQVSVAAGQDGRLWKFSNSLGHRVLLTVPPYLARDSHELILPAEVVRADAPK